MNAGNGSEPAAPSPPPRRSRRRWLLIGTITLGLLLVVLVVAPRFAAGWIAKTQLERLGIASEGVDSLAIKLWNSRIDLGAVEFWGAGAERGRIESVSMTYDLNNLFAGRALVDWVRIRGIDIRVTRDDQGRITVNGIELTELLGPPQDGEELPEAPADEGERGGLAFGVGLDGFLLESSRALLETDVGGALQLEIDRLVVEDIRSWDPDHPAVIDLIARANDIEIDAKAQAHLFADTIMVDARVSLDSVDLHKVSRFTGPLGFERREGEVSIDLAVSMQIEPDGRVMIAGYGDITHDGAELARPGLEYRVEQHRIDLYGAVIAEPVRTEGEKDAAIVMRAAGDARVRFQQVGVNAPGTGELTFDQAVTHLANISAVRDPDGLITFEAAPTIDVTAPRASGPFGFESSRVALAVPALRGTVDGEAIALRAAGAVEVDRAKLDLPGAEGEAGPTAAAGVVRTTFDDLAVSIAPDRSEVSGTVGVKVGDLAVELPGTAMATVEALDVALEALQVVAAKQGLGLGVTGTSEIAGAEAELMDGPKLELSRLSSDLDAVDLALNPAGGIEAAGTVALTLADLAAGMPFGQGTAEGTLDEIGVALADLQLVMSEDGAASLVSAGSLELAGLAAALPPEGGRPAATVGLAGLSVTLDRLAGETGGESPRFEVASSIEADSVEATTLGEGAGSVRLSALSLEGLEADQTPAVAARSLTLAGLELDASDRTIQALAGAPANEAGSEEGRPEAAAGNAAPSEAASSAPSGAMPALRLGKLTIERPAVVRFADTSVDPPMEVATEFGAEIANLDTTDPSQRADLGLDATINEKAELALAGWATAADPPDFDLDVDLRDLQLGLASPYAAAAVGMDIESGEFGTATAVTASGGALEGQIDLEVEDLVLVPVSEAAAEEASSALGVPVTAVVGLLEDSEGRIELGLPVSGTLEEPDVDITEAINKALAGTIETLFPPTAIAGMLMSEGGTIEFQPISFEPGSAELGDEARGVIDGFVALLNEKPRLEVLPCGRATSADAGQPGGEAAAEQPDDQPDAEQPQADAPPKTAAAQPSKPPAVSAHDASDAMIDLAEARALAVETYLVEEQGLAPERVRECRPRYDPEDTGPPRVDLTLT